MAETAPFAPKIHMPDPEAEALRAAYRDARVIGEYGAGGSTAFAATECDARLLSIESDRDWVAKLQDWIDAQGVMPGPPCCGANMRLGANTRSACWRSPRYCRCSS